ncbi:Swi5-domain-containing protein [Dipodascopsis tothii]|uniref:Swi5-domain-containing protein n=1 Tax=Dipodascopsis tothii TaxID=44089 RepID=UPI0034CF26DC
MIPRWSPRSSLTMTSKVRRRPMALTTEIDAFDASSESGMLSEWDGDEPAHTGSIPDHGTALYLDDPELPVVPGPIQFERVLLPPPVQIPEQVPEPDRSPKRPATALTDILDTPEDTPEYDERSAKRLAVSEPPPARPEATAAENVPAEQPVHDPPTAPPASLAPSELPVRESTQEELALARIEQKREKLARLNDEYAQQAAQLDDDPERIVRTHLRLHRTYNEIREIGLGLIGMVADVKGVDVREIMAHYGVRAGD